MIRGCVKRLLVHRSTPLLLSATSLGPMLSSTWSGNFGGVPPFDAVRPEAFVESFRTAIDNALANADAVATQPEAPTFDNTVAKMETIATELDHLGALFGVHANNLNVGPMNEIEGQVTPMLAAYGDKLVQNAPLFQRVKVLQDAIANGALTASLSEEQQRLVKERFKEFVRNGANLNDQDKQRLTEINQRLAALFTTFGQNILEEEKSVVIVDTKGELNGVPDSIISSYAEMATKRGADGKYAIQNTRSSVEPFLHYATDRALRKKVWSQFVNRGANDNAANNYGVIQEILTLRKERAALLGYASHAAWRIETEMARTPERALGLLMEVWPKAVQAVQAEVKDMLAIATKEDPNITAIEPWDYRFYSEKVRLARYNLDFNEVVPYLDAERLREGMFWAAGALHDISFEPVTDVPVFHPDVRVWEVKRVADNSHVGLFYFDPFCRDGKRSGAWMTEYRNQSTLTNATPIISNNSNFVKSDPLLISWDDAVTMFHEFGHGLHGLLSKVTYGSMAGTSVARDFVEFPSQLNELWLETAEVLERFATHHKTGEPMPQVLLDKIRKASNFNQGFKTVEYLSCALLDMKLHMGGGDAAIANVQQFEVDTLSSIGMPREISMRHRLAHFAHIFSTDSYSAGYYSYLWADTLVADAAEAFKSAPGGFYDKDVAKNLRDNVLSKGNSVDPAASFVAFRGRDVDTTALMRKRGFI